MSDIKFSSKSLKKSGTAKAETSYPQDTPDVMGPVNAVRRPADLDHRSEPPDILNVSGSLPSIMKMVLEEAKKKK